MALREGMAEHRAYLASAGVVMTLAGIVLSKQKSPSRELPNMFGLAVVTVMCLVLAVMTVARNDGVERSGKALAWRNDACA